MLNRLFSLDFKKSALIWFPWAVAGFILDQCTKFFAVQYLILGHSFKIFPGFNLSLVYNYGAAFGFMNQRKTWQVLFLILIAIIAICGFTLWLARVHREQRLEAWGIILILSGAIGNLFDRLYYGYVIDFLDVYIATWHWPAFNLADSFICVGAALVLIHAVMKDRATSTHQ